MAGLERGPANPAPFSLGLATQPSFDALALLPERAADLLRKLRQRAHDLNSLIPPFEDRHAASNAKTEAERWLTRLQAHPSTGGFGLKDDDERVIAARKQVEKAAADLERMTRLHDERSAAWREAGFVLQACERWLRDGRPGGTALVDFDGEPPKLLKGESVIDAIERLRRRVRELRADAKRISDAPYPSSHARAKVRQEVEALALQGAPSVSDVVEHDRKIVWPTRNERAEVVNIEGRGITFVQTTDALALTCWLHKSTLIAALDREIDSESDDKNALTSAEREKRTAVVDADLLAVERDEAALVWTALAQNLPAFHRSDVNPLAILQCRLITAPTATNGQGSSPGMSWPWPRK